jgi:molecular chaperone DnaJ
MMDKDYYGILGVPKDASSNQIKDAYRKLVMRYHPDRNKEQGTETKMREINEAYAVLGDPEKRRQYDAFGPDQFNQHFSEEDIFRGFNSEDIFRDIFSNFGGMGGFGGMFGQQEEAQQTGVNLYLSFDDLERGVNKEFAVQHYKVCSNCRGSGGEPGSKQTKCAACNGSGRRHMQQNTPFGRLQVMTTCDRCGGRGKSFEHICRECNGNGRVVVTDKYRVRAEKSDKDAGQPKKKFW